jgi:hypothetical protein
MVRRPLHASVASGPLIQFNDVRIPSGLLWRLVCCGASGIELAPLKRMPFNYTETPFGNRGVCIVQSGMLDPRPWILLDAFWMLCSIHSVLWPNVLPSRRISSIGYTHDSASAQYSFSSINYICLEHRAGPIIAFRFVH